MICAKISGSPKVYGQIDVVQQLSICFVLYILHHSWTPPLRKGGQTFPKLPLRGGSKILNFKGGGVPGKGGIQNKGGIGTFFQYFNYIFPSLVLLTQCQVFFYLLSIFSSYFYILRVFSVHFRQFRVNFGAFGATPFWSQYLGDDRYFIRGDQM